MSHVILGKKLLPWCLWLLRLWIHPKGFIYIYIYEWCDHIVRISWMDFELPWYIGLLKWHKNTS
jgi:hypothetical protein